MEACTAFFIFTLALLSAACVSAFDIPFLTGDPCKHYDCVRGKCEKADGFPNVRCICDQGWKNVLNMSFLSCAIPNCDFNVHCDKASKKQDTAAAPEPSSSLVNPCTYSICGEGDCVPKNDSELLSGYTCKCHQGYGNLLNSSSSLCVSSCNIGADCSQLGIGWGPSSSPSTNTNANATALNSNSAAATSRLQYYYIASTGFLLLVLL